MVCRAVFFCLPATILGTISVLESRTSAQRKQRSSALLQAHRGQRLFPPLQILHMHMCDHLPEHDRYLHRRHVRPLPALRWATRVPVVPERRQPPNNEPDLRRAEAPKASAVLPTRVPGGAGPPVATPTSTVSRAESVRGVPTLPAARTPRIQA